MDEISKKLAQELESKELRANRVFAITLIPHEELTFTSWLKTGHLSP
jgi:hypothetical protein